MIKVIKGVIFDLDGTLLNTLEDLKNAVNYALKKKNKPTIDLKTTKSYIGNGIRRLVTLSLNETNDNIINEALVDFKYYYANHILDNTKCYDNVIETLNYLKENNIKSSAFYYHVKKLRNKACEIPENTCNTVRQTQEVVPLVIDDMPLSKPQTVITESVSLSDEIALRLTVQGVTMEITNHATQTLIQNVIAALRYSC